MRSFFILAAFLSTALLSGCTSKNNDRYQTRGGNFWDIFAPDSPYETTFDDNTLQRRVQSDFEGVMTAHITHWNTEVREAYIKEMSAQYRMQPEQAANLSKEQSDEEKKFHVFIVSAATKEPAWADFHKKNSIWRITLENKEGSLQQDAEWIELISYRDERAKYFYRKSDTFTTTYKIRFLRGVLDAESSFFFNISGPRGAISAEFPNRKTLLKRNVDDSTGDR